MKLLKLSVCFLFVTACATIEDKSVEIDGNANYLQSSAVELAEGLKTGQYSSEELAAFYLDRIEELDRHGPEINSVLSLNKGIISLAQERDSERRDGKIRGRLHGVPILVKDNIETSDLPTTGGSLALADNQTGRDAPVIARLKAEGAIVLGKTNLSEWANFRSDRSVSGWSGIAGLTKNPHSLNRSPCGSSAGSAAAIAAGFAPLALGTETNGSITCPAAMNGIVGFKPTVGLLSNRHIIPVSTTQDTVGPMAKTVADIALMMDVMTASSGEFSLALDNTIDGLRIGVFRWAEGKDPRISEAFNAAVEQLEAQGAVMVDISEYEPDPILWQGGETVLTTQFKNDINTYLKSLPKHIGVRTLSDLINFNEAQSERELGLFDQSKFIEAAKAPPVSDPDHIKLLGDITKASRTNGIDRLLSDHNVDALIMPSAKLPSPVDLAFTSRPVGGPVGASWLPAMAGYPSLSIPMGDYLGLPMGLMVVGTANDDAKVLRIGHAYQVASGIKVTPQFTDMLDEQSSLLKPSLR